MTRLLNAILLAAIVFVFLCLGLYLAPIFVNG